MSVGILNSTSPLDMMLSRIDDTGPRVDAVVGKLVRAIDLGILRDGEKLPSETDLASHLGISTIVLREGLTILRTQGLIETTRGRGGGSFIRCDPAAAIDRARQSLERLSTHDLRDMGDEHVAISGMAARLAAERASPSEVEDLRQQIIGFEKSKNLLEMRRGDSKFHIWVAQMSQSSRLTHAEVRLQASLAPLIWQPLVSTSLAGEVVSHRRIADAIANEDPDGARNAAEAHVLDNFKGLMKTIMGGLRA